MERKEQRILILEDNIDDFGLMYQQLRALSYHGDDIYKFGTLNNLLSVPKGENKVVLVKYAMLGEDPVGALQKLQSTFSHTPIIITSDITQSSDAAELMKAGAQDCLVTGQFNHETLGHTINMANVRQQATQSAGHTINEAIAAIREVPEPIAEVMTPAPIHKEEPVAVAEPKVAEPKIEHITITADNNYRLFDESPIPMWIYELQTGRIQKVNASAIYHYGYSEDEFLMMNIKELRAEGDKPTDVEVIKIPTLNSFYNSSRRKHVKAGGEQFFVQVYTHTILYEEHSAGMMMALDINNKQQNEQHTKELNEIIQQKNRQFDDILSSVSEVIWSCNADDSSILYINNACEAVYGYTPQELMENRGILASLIHPGDIEKVEEAYLSLAKTGVLNVEHRVYDKDGVMKIIVTKAVLKKESEDKPGYINGITIDVTRMREIERKLMESARERENILESITDGFFAINKKWEFTYVNREFENILHLSGQDLIGKNIWETIQGVEEMQAYSELYKAVKENKTVHFEEYFPPLKKWLAVNAYPAKEGLAVYFRDITEEKNRILKIEEQNAKLTEIAWLQSHKVRGPVASILGLIQLFNYDDPADPVNKEILEGVKYATNGLDDIIKEVVEKTTSMHEKK
jgi:PAS domain S-box-containing protein